MWQFIEKMSNFTPSSRYGSLLDMIDSRKDEGLLLSEYYQRFIERHLFLILAAK